MKEPIAIHFFSRLGSNPIMAKSLGGKSLLIAAALCLSTGSLLPAQVEAPGTKEQLHGPELFRRLVQPLLKERCLGCHGLGDDEIQGGLDMTSREKLLQGGQSGPAIEPGKPEESLLFELVTGEGYPAMPPKQANRLNKEELAALRRWIETGAPWPAAESAKTDWVSEEADRWAFRPLLRPDPPALASSAAGNGIDAFLNAAILAKGIQAAAPADRRTLLRRASFDLTGLPPSPTAVDAFLADPRPDESAFAQVVERLLASPLYGEQWGRHWLDVVRYSDTSGFSNDFPRPSAWRYRDYVIRAFNEDKPYDRFIMEQVAGDEIEPENPEMAVAVGFLRMGPWEHTGMSVAAATRQLFLDDVTHNTANAFLGLTMGCAKCHDHKFDPLPARDYYSFQAAFATTAFSDHPAPYLPSENISDFTRAKARIQADLAFHQLRLEEIKAKHQEAVEALLKEYKASKVEELPESVRPKDNRYGLTDADQERERVHSKRIELLKQELKGYDAVAFSVRAGKSDPPVVAVLLGGAIESPGEEVAPGVLSAVVEAVRVYGGTQEIQALSRIPVSDKGRRTALARWIASPENPLTARVLVNRVWQYHFGRGLVETSNNFGKMGKRPTHPELLDWLAREFIDRGWSIKELHRLIMNSAAYKRCGEPIDPQQIADLDPLNQLLSFFPPRRLTAEEIRDSILAVTGELSLKRGGPAVFPELNREVATQPRQIMGTIAPAYRESPTKEERHRRTIYTLQMRNLPNPLLEVFNAADMNNSCERRDASTVAPQVFALFNGRFPRSMALAMAQRIENLAENPAEQIQWAFRLAFSRQPTPSELERCEQYLEKVAPQVAQAPAKEDEPRELLRRHVGELSGLPFEFVESWETEGHEPNLEPCDVPPSTRALAGLCLVLINSNEFLYIY